MLIFSVYPCSQGSQASGVGAKISGAFVQELAIGNLYPPPTLSLSLMGTLEIKDTRDTILPFCLMYSLDLHLLSADSMPGIARHRENHNMETQSCPQELTEKNKTQTCKEISAWPAGCGSVAEH